MQKVCLDTGIFGIYFGKDIPDRKKILKILEGSITKEYEIHVLRPVLSEVFYHLCLNKGQSFARSKIISLKFVYPIKQISLDDDLIAKTGQLKCQNRKNLSYIDCMSISYCLLNKIPFHTTEKKIKQIPNPLLNRLKIVRYRWD
ncbi:MAG: type II toxin-antitoxin system VapC family toxin [Promethearchaeota archaeon]